MLESQLREVRPGEEVLAEDHNALVRTVRRLYAMLSGLPTGDLDDAFVLRGVVTAVDRPVDADDRTIANVFYNVQPIRRSTDAMLEEVRPINPPTNNSALVIITCEVGDPCIVLRMPNAGGTGHELKMVQLTETLDDGVCPEEP